MISARLSLLILVLTTCLTACQQSQSSDNCIVPSEHPECVSSTAVTDTNMPSSTVVSTPPLLPSSRVVAKVTPDNACNVLDLPDIFRRTKATAAKTDNGQVSIQELDGKKVGIFCQYSYIDPNGRPFPDNPEWNARVAVMPTTEEAQQACEGEYTHAPAGKAKKHVIQGGELVTVSLQPDIGEIGVLCASDVVVAITVRQVDSWRQDVTLEVLTEVARRLDK